MQLLDVAVLVAAEALRVDAPVAGDALLVRRRRAQDHRPVGPAELGTVLRRLGQELELVHRRRAVTVRRAETVGARVAAAQDDDALVGGEELSLDPIARDRLVLLRQELHREVDALQVAARDGQVARTGGAGREHDRIEVAPQVVAGHVDADVHTRPEGDALGRHLLHATVDQPLLHLEVGDAVAQQAADAVVALEERHRMPGPRELLGARHARGTRADHGDALAGLALRPLRRHPALGPGVIDDVLLDVLDGDRVVVDVEDARLLARRGTDAAGELGEVVRRVQALDRLTPAAAVHEVVPVGDDVPERAALVAERDAAIHAARALRAQRLLGGRFLELAPVLEARLDRLLVNLLALELEESGDLSHECVRQTAATRAASVSRCCVASTFAYSTGMTRTNRFWVSDQSASSRAATPEPVRSRWRWIRSLRVSTSPGGSGSTDTSPMLQCPRKSPSSSRTYATPPLMPAAKLRPVLPSTTTSPFVMYSQPWSPTPSTTAVTPLLRTQNRSPACPRRKTSPPVAPYSETLPTMMLSSGTNVAVRGGYTTMRPPESPLPK